jgi:hypothetical protein
MGVSGERSEVLPPRYEQFLGSRRVPRLIMRLSRSWLGCLLRPISRPMQPENRVPNGINPDEIEANFKNGVLTITLPKTPEALKKEKKITVKAG